jgi:hypothetical protein
MLSTSRQFLESQSSTEAPMMLPVGARRNGPPWAPSVETEQAVGVQGRTEEPRRGRESHPGHPEYDDSPRRAARTAAELGVGGISSPRHGDPGARPAGHPRGGIVGGIVGAPEGTALSPSEVLNNLE